MNEMRNYQAPWGKSLKWTSALLVVLALGMQVGMSLLPEGPMWSQVLARWTFPVIVIGCLPFMVRSYDITKDAVFIHRLFWTTRISRIGLRSAEEIPQAMKESLRTFGISGGFSYTGWFWNKSLGSYRAFVTDLDRTVVLRFESRMVVVSPDRPDEFVRELIGEDELG